MLDFLNISICVTILCGSFQRWTYQFLFSLYMHAAQYLKWYYLLSPRIWTRLGLLHPLAYDRTNIIPVLGLDVRRRSHIRGASIHQTVSIAFLDPLAQSMREATWMTLAKVLWTRPLNWASSTTEYWKIINSWCFKPPSFRVSC